MRIIFMGTPLEASSILEELVKEEHQILAVVTQPDRPKGRGQKLAPPPVKEIALKHSLPLEQPEKVGVGSPLDIARGKFVGLLESLRPDVIVVVAYGKILPKEIIDIPKYGCINVHASLLPKYRGAA
ncbi:MAG: methionyl-tRNA formyltransferase, partial [Candidatus Margulisiibacteriota bacterium]